MSDKSAPPYPGPKALFVSRTQVDDFRIYRSSRLEVAHRLGHLPSCTNSQFLEFWRCYIFYREEQGFYVQGTSYAPLRATVLFPIHPKTHLWGFLPWSGSNPVVTDSKPSALLIEGSTPGSPLGVSVLDPWKTSYQRLKHVNNKTINQFQKFVAKWMTLIPGLTDSLPGSTCSLAKYSDIRGI